MNTDYITELDLLQQVESDYQRRLAAYGKEDTPVKKHRVARFGDLVMLLATDPSARDIRIT